MKNDFFNSSLGVNKGLLRHMTNNNNLLNDIKKSTNNSHFYKSENFTKKLIDDIVEHHQVDTTKQNSKTIPKAISVNNDEQNIMKNSIKLPMEDHKLSEHNIKQDKVEKSSDLPKPKSKSTRKKENFTKNEMYTSKSPMKSANFIPNYVNMTPSEPTNSYKFREIKKEKWLVKTNFNV